MFFCHSCHRQTPTMPCTNCQSDFVEELSSIDPVEEISHAFLRAIHNRSNPQSPTQNTTSPGNTSVPGFTFSFQNEQNQQHDNNSHRNGPRNHRHSQNDQDTIDPTTNDADPSQTSQDMLFNIFDLINSVGEGMPFNMGEGGLNDLLNTLFTQHEPSERPVPTSVLSRLKKKEFLIPRDCAICQDTLEYGLELICKHCYHEDCIKEWFKQQNTCPICRAKVCDDEDCDPVERPTSAPPPRRNMNQNHNRSRSVPRDPFNLFVNTSNDDRSPISPPIRRRYIQPGSQGFVMMESDTIDDSTDNIPLPHQNRFDPPQHASQGTNNNQNNQTDPPRRRSFFSRLFHPN